MSGGINTIRSRPPFSTTWTPSGNTSPARSPSTSPIRRPLAAMTAQDADTVWRTLPPGDRGPVLAALHDAFDWAIRDGRAAGPNPFGRVLASTSTLRSQPVIPMADVERLLSQIRSPKHRLIFTVQAAGGLRLGDVLGLRAGDLLPDGVLVADKAGRERFALIPPDVLAHLQRYAAGRRSDEYLFRPEGGPTSGQNAPMGPKGLYVQFREAARRAGLDPDTVTPDTLRHSVAVHATDGARWAEVVPGLLGTATTTAQNPTRGARRRRRKRSHAPPDLGAALDRALER